MRYLLILAGLFGLCALPGCNGGNASSSGGEIVSAQTTYSNASLSGTYAFSIVSTNSQNILFAGGGTGPYTAIGTLQFNGTGGLTGSIAATAQNAVTCQVSMTGTYSLQSTGLGNASLIMAPQSATCLAVTVQFSVAAAQGGTSVLLTQSSATQPSTVIYGTAIKQ